MFLDIKGKPKKVIIQKRTHSGSWSDVATYRDLEGLNFKKCVSVLRMKESENPGDYRLIIRGKKSKRELQVLSSSTLPFRYLVELLTKNKSMHLMADGLKMFADNENPHVLPAANLIQWIRESGGLKKVKHRDTCKEDGELNTYDVTFGDGSKHTFSIFYSK